MQYAKLLLLCLLDVTNLTVDCWVVSSQCQIILSRFSQMRVLGILQEKRDLVMKNGDLGNCDPGCVNLSFCVEGESFIMALFPGSTCTCASLQPMLMLNALSAQDDLQEVFHYTLEKTLQEVRIVRYNPPPASPRSRHSPLFTRSSSYSSFSSSLSSLCSSNSTGPSSLSSLSP